MPRKRKPKYGPHLPYNWGKGKAYACIMAHINYEGDDCIQWPFSHFQGIGHVSHKGKHYKAPRFMCTLIHGEPPTPEHEAAHECGNGHLKCMNPRHIKWKTRVENRADCYRHGTAGRITGKKKMTPEMVYAIRGLEGHATGTAVAAAFGVSDDTVYSIWKRRQWPSLPERQTPRPTFAAATPRDLGREF